MTKTRYNQNAPSVRNRQTKPQGNDKVAQEYERDERTIEM